MKLLAADLDGVCRLLRESARLALAVHEKPDLDALGAAAGLLDLCGQLGVPATLRVDPAELLPFGEQLLGPNVVSREAPKAGEVLVALDSGSLERLALDLGTWSGTVVNIDHHHDNTRFGDVVLVRPAASSTSEIVCDLARVLGVTPRRRAAAALYAGISFDTGHFRHACTGPAAFAAAAWLAGLGIDVTAVYRDLYERRTVGAVQLEGRALAAARAAADGRALIAVLRRADYEATGAAEHETEGIVDRLRSVDGVEVAALVKEQTAGGGPRVRVSLRSNGFDVSALAAARGGGGHRQAAGFGSDDDPEEVTAWLSSELARRLPMASS